MQEAISAGRLVPGILDEVLRLAAHEGLCRGCCWPGVAVLGLPPALLGCPQGPEGLKAGQPAKAPRGRNLHGLPPQPLADWLRLTPIFIWIQAPPPQVVGFGDPSYCASRPLSWPGRGRAREEGATAVLGCGSVGGHRTGVLRPAGRTHRRTKNPAPTLTQACPLLLSLSPFTSGLQDPT